MDARRSRHAAARRRRRPLWQPRPARLPDHLRRNLARGRFSRTGGARTEETGMTEAELLALRTVLADRCSTLLDRLAVTLLDRLAITAEDGNLPAGQIVEPGFLRLLADLHTTIAAVDAALAEFVTGD